MSSYYSLKFIEKSNEALFKLATGTGNAKQRLMDAQTEMYLSLTWPIGSKEFDDRLEALWKELNLKGPILFEDKTIMTAYANTVSDMRNKTASGIIAEFLSLKFEIDYYLRSGAPHLFP